MIETSRRGWERWLGLAGIGYVVVHFLFLTHGSADPGSSAAAVQRAFRQGATVEMQSGLLYQMTVLLLLLFAAGLRAHLRPAEREPRTLSTAVLGTAFAAGALGLVGSGILFVLEANVARLGDAGLTYSLFVIWWATFFGYSLLLGVMAIAASASALATRALPRWIGWLGVACGLALMSGCLAFYPSGARVEGPADSVAYVGELLFAVWTVASSVVILRGHRTVAKADAAELRTEVAAAG